MASRLFYTRPGCWEKVNITRVYGVLINNDFLLLYCSCRSLFIRRTGEIESLNEHMKFRATEKRKKTLELRPRVKRYY